MATTQNTIPLWLDIKTEHIDENFEKVIDYLKAGNKKDTFYQTTVELLGKRVEEYLKTLKTRPVSYTESIDIDTAKLKFETRLLAAYLLVKNDADTVQKKRLYMPFIHSLSLLVTTELCGDLLNLMVDNMLCKNEPALLFGWDDVCNFEPLILAHKIINGVAFKSINIAEANYERRGCMSIWDKGLGIAPYNLNDFRSKQTQITSSLDVLGGKIKLLTNKNQKLKQSEEYNIDSIETHVLDFVQDQSNVKAAAEKRKKIYSEKDNLLAVVTSCTWGKIEVKSIDPDYETIEGTIRFDSANFIYYYIEDFYKYLRDGQIIDVTLDSLSEKQFTIKDRFIEYVIEDIVKSEDYIGRVENAKVAKIYQDKRGEMQMDWLTESGFPVHTRYYEGFQQNEFGRIKVTIVSSGSYYGYVGGEVVDGFGNPFDFQQSKKSVIAGFDFEGYDTEEDADNSSMLDTAAIRDLLNMMVRYQKTIVVPTERFRLLSVSLAMATLIEAHEHQAYIRFIMSYLKQLIRFAKGEYEKIDVIVPDSSISNIGLVQQRCDVIKILKAYDNVNGNAELEAIIEESEDDTLIKIAKLIQSCNIIGGVIPASTKNIIKREITKSLSLETEDETNLDEENGIYLGIEDLHQEFKTSFIYPPDNDMQPNVFMQEKNIFRCLCGFLNSDGGGTLYIGVTDLGYVCGFENDMKYLRFNELDTYIRYIQDEAKKFFGVDVLTHFYIKPVYDNRAMAIRVVPYENELIEFEGKAYIRINNETREMNEKLKKLIKAKKAMK